MTSSKITQWGQTIVVLLAIVTACVSGARCVDGSISKLHGEIVAVQTTHELDQAAIVRRLTLGGFSRPQAQRFVDRLRDLADHPIPALE